MITYINMLSFKLLTPEEEYKINKLPEDENILDPFTYATGSKEEQRRLEYLAKLKAQIKIIDVIGKRHYDIKKGATFTTEKPYRSLADQLKDASYQRNEAYKNAYTLFDKDTTRVNEFMQLIGTDMYPAFNAYAPVIIKELKPKYSFLLPKQVIEHLERLMLKQEITKDVDMPIRFDPEYINQKSNNAREFKNLDYLKNLFDHRNELQGFVELDIDIKKQIIKELVDGNNEAKGLYLYLTEDGADDDVLDVLFMDIMNRINMMDINEQNRYNLEQILRDNNISYDLPDDYDTGSNVSIPSIGSSNASTLPSNTSNNSLSVNPSTNSSLPSIASSTDIPTKNLFIKQSDSSNETDQSPIVQDGSDENNIDIDNTIESIEQTPTKVDYDTLPDAPSLTPPYVDPFEGLPNASDIINPNTIDDPTDLDPIVLSTINNDYPNVSNLYMMTDNDISNIDLAIKKDIILHYHDDTEIGEEYVNQRISTHEHFLNLTNSDATEILQDLINIVSIDNLNDNVKAAINNTLESKAVEEEKDELPSQFVDFKDDEEYLHYTTLQTTNMTTLTNALSGKSLKSIIDTIVSENLDARLIKTSQFKTLAIFNKSSKKELAKFLIDIMTLPISDAIKTQINEIIANDPKSVDHFTL